MEEIIERIRKDLKKSAQSMTRSEARYLVDCYYSIQDYRIHVDGQIRAHTQHVDDQPLHVLAWLGRNVSVLEGQIKLALKHYASNDPVGTWSLGICGIGPVISSGLLAHIDMDKADTPGHIWSFAGLDPSRKWIGSDASKKIMKQHGVSPSGKKAVAGPLANQVLLDASNASGVKLVNLTQMAVDAASGQYTGESIYQAISRRPWNERLKVLCWKIGESFVKVSSNKSDVYGKLYLQRKQEESAKNAKGDYAQQAAAVLQRTPNHKQASIYRAGRLPDGHIHSRCKRWAVKLFLSHWWEVAYEHHHGKKPPFQPYPIDHLGHVHKIMPPGIV
jgi:hypothetical protein